MNCQEFIREWSELEDAMPLTAALEQHRQECRSCSEMLEDVSYIAEQARAMKTDGELGNDPHERVWLCIQERLVEDGLVRARRGFSRGWLRSPAAHAGWFLRLSTGMAYAAVFCAAVGVMYLHSLLQAPAAPPILAASPQVPAMALAKAPPQSPNVEELAQRVPPEQRAILVSNWNQVNSSIQQLNDSREHNPDDPFINRQLMNALQQRQELWETFVRWEQF